jgi:lipopolysaccharide export system protein LptA
MILSGRRALTGLALLLVLSAAVARSAAQEQSSGGAMQGLSLKSDQPVKIESSTLEVRDKIRQATFMGDVKLVQGDTTLKCDTLVVFYEDTAMAGSKKGGQPAGAQAQKGGAGSGGQQIKRAEAKGNVFVTQKDQTASGEFAVYDAKANTVTMTGSVVVTQGAQVMRGERMVANLTTGVTRVEAPKGRQIELMIQPGAKDGPALPAPAAKAAPAAKDAKATPAPPKSAPGLPARIN